MKFHIHCIFSSIHKNKGVEKYGYNINTIKIPKDIRVIFFKYNITIPTHKITSVQ